MSTTQQPEALMRLADNYAEACFDQGLNQRTTDDKPETEWEKLEKAIRRMHTRISELEAQLSAIGAGGVEPLRKQVVPETLVVPDGYALMPIEPTAGICKAAADGWLDCGSKMVLNKAGAAYRSSVAYFMKKGTQS